MNQKLTIRAILIGCFLSALMAMSAVYLALRMNSFYWASILTSLLAVAFLRPISKLMKTPTTVHEVNMTQTMGSTGGIAAAGICFTIPALYFIEPEWLKVIIENPFDWILKIAIISLIGGWLGIILSTQLRKPMIEDARLPFPTGIAAADTIQSTIGSGTGLGTLLGTFGIAAVFTMLRDGLGTMFRGVIPFFVGKQFHGLNFQVGFIPMTLGGGYLIGMRTAMIWLAGCLVSNWIYQPILINQFDISVDNMQLHDILPVGIGIVVGSGIFLLFKILLPKLRPAFHALVQTKTRSKRTLLIPATMIIAILAMSTILDIPWPGAIVAGLGLWITTVLASWMAGETNIDPMEILAVLVVVGIQVIVHLTHLQAVLLTAVIAVAVGVAADLLFDLKAASILGTSPRHITIAQFIGVVPAALVVGISLIALLKTYTPGSADLYALQAQIVAFMLGAQQWLFFGVGCAIGAAMTALGVSGLAFGVGFFIPMFFSVGFAIGGLVRWISDTHYPQNESRLRLIAAGLIGGEGVTGTALAIGSMLLTL